ncbi:hypothetical protein D3093_31520 (plasmid) [Azospirillum argentinense]|uniref:Secreted protein n=3 Tax=Azospirillum TaxID=191 RepID=A0A4D8QLT1_AZOBR|nr:hypothetical protein D3093_31520 [Azospirillum argentinense]QCO06422.1 hypothetical protein D3867_31460 [Azospirillum argentinense]
MMTMVTKGHGHRRVHAALALCLAAALLGHGRPAEAQDAEEWRAIDIRQEIRTHFDRLPYGWWIREPELHLNTYEVEVHLPDWWRGNPTSAVNDLCPERQSRIWKVAKILTLRPFYQKRPWPEVDCRR